MENKVTVELKKQAPLLVIVLRGIGQIMLQENMLTGLCFLMAILWVSKLMALGLLVGALVGSLTAFALNYNRADIDAGLYGFSAALVGVGLLVYFQSSVLLWVFIVLGSMAAAVIQHLFISRKIPGFTFPFVLVTWVCLAVLKNANLVPLAAAPNWPEVREFSFIYVLRAWGQVIFQDQMLVGLFFMVGVAFASRAAAFWGLVAAFLSGLLAKWLGMSLSSIEMGLFGYNAVLCAIVFAEWKGNAVFWVIISLIFALLIQWLMNSFSLLLLTFPFVAATWLSLFLRLSLSSGNVRAEA